jgi:CO/xanthine dehydrogenase Mo-binding subunit
MQRSDLLMKTTGQARFTSDQVLPGALTAKVLRSPHAHAYIRQIDATQALRVPGVLAVLTRDSGLSLNGDVGGKIKDRPLVARDRVRYIGDVVAAVAAETEAAALEGLAQIKVDYEPLKAVTSVHEALHSDAPDLYPFPPPAQLPKYGEGVEGAIFPDKNTCFAIRMEHGDPEAWELADHIYTDTFQIARANHYHLEAFVSLVDASPEAVRIWTSTQSPFRVRDEVAQLFGYARDRVQVHVGYVGGGFGSKFGCRTEHIATALSLMAGRPVRLCFTHEEAFLTSGQHAGTVTMTTGVTNAGQLIARTSQVLLDAGAYSDASLQVVEKAVYRAQGPYRWRHVAGHGSAVLTNTPPGGPYRGFGGTHVSWAGESQIDMIARRLGMSPVQLRRMNLLRLGERFHPNDTPMDSDLVDGFNRVVEALDLECRAASERKAGIGMAGSLGDTGSDRTRQGVGFAVGVKDGGGVNKEASARVIGHRDGSVTLLCGTVEIGQGAMDGMARIVARELSISVDKVTVPFIDTHVTPVDTATSASSGMVVMGNAVVDASRALRQQLLSAAASITGCPVSELTLRDGRFETAAGSVTTMKQVFAQVFDGSGLQPQGEAMVASGPDALAPLGARTPYWEVSWAACQAQVDLDSGLVEPTILVVVGDAGTVVSPMAVKGQELGAALMGLGLALFEEVTFDRGGVTNGTGLEYRLPMARDLPATMVVTTLEQGHGPGPYGAKGVGEAAVLGIAPAVANAVEDATGVRVSSLPLTPMKVLARMQESSIGKSVGVCRSLDSSATRKLT